MVANDKRESLDVSARSLARGGGYAALNKDISLYLSRALGVRRRSISQTSFPATTKNKLTARQREDLARGSYCFSPAEFHPPPRLRGLSTCNPLRMQYSRRLFIQKKISRQTQQVIASKRPQPSDIFRKKKLLFPPRNIYNSDLTIILKRKPPSQKYHLF